MQTQPRCPIHYRLQHAVLFQQMADKPPSKLMLMLQEISVADFMGSFMP